MADAYDARSDDYAARPPAGGASGGGGGGADAPPGPSFLDKTKAFFGDVKRRMIEYWQNFDPEETKRRIIECVLRTSFAPPRRAHPHTPLRRYCELESIDTDGDAKAGWNSLTDKNKECIAVSMLGATLMLFILSLCCCCCCCCCCSCCKTGASSFHGPFTPPQPPRSTHPVPSTSTDKDKNIEGHKINERGPPEDLGELLNPIQKGPSAKGVV